MSMQLSSQVTTLTTPRQSWRHITVQEVCGGGAACLQGCQRRRSRREMGERVSMSGN